MIITRIEVIHSDQERVTVRPLPALCCGGSCVKPVGCCASRTQERDLSLPLERCSLQCPEPGALQVGQQLELGIRSSEILRLALLLYLTPVVGLLFGALLLERLGVSEGWVVSGAFIVAGGCWLGVRAIINTWTQPLTFHALIED